MPKKKPVAIPILLKISIFLGKLKKPIIPMLVSIKKTRNLKKCRLLRQYSYYSYVKEYEFSPWSTPLIQFPRKSRNFVGIPFRKLYFSKCLGMMCGKEEKERLYLDSLPCTGENAENRKEIMVLDLSEYSSGELDSVDERAEMFIQKFYEEMRRQKQESQFLLEM